MLYVVQIEVKMKEEGGSVVGSEVGTQIGQRQIRH